MKVKRFLNLMLAASALVIPAVAQAGWDAAADEANRQRAMASMRATDAANDRRNADAAFQSGLSRNSGSPSSGSSSSSSSSGSGASYRGGTGGGGSTPSGPQSVVATKTVRVYVRETPQQGVARTLREALAGNVDSQYYVGRAYYAGFGTARDEVQARRWFTAAAAQGHIAASAYAGYFAYFGRGGPVDRANALVAIKRASDGGDVFGQSLAGYTDVLDAFESRSKRSIARSVAMLESSADQGQILSQALLGTIVFYYGINDVPANGAKAVKYLKLAVAQDHTVAKNVLGRLYIAGDPDTGKDVAKGWTLIRAAADAGNDEAQRTLGMSMIQGSNGQTKDVAGGLRYVKLAVAQSYPPSLVDMAQMNFAGEVMPKDEVAALRFALEAATLGNADGQLMVGEFYYFGQGTAKDRREAVRWFQKAAAQGNAAAIENLKDDELAAIARAM